MPPDPAAAVSGALQSVRAAVAQGIIDAAGEIRRQSVKRTPVDTGNLRKTAEIVIDGTVATTAPRGSAHTRIIAVRYAAPYAAHVHNAKGTARGRPRAPPHRGRYWDPAGSGPQFLAQAVDIVSPRIASYVNRRIQQELPK